MLQPQQTQGGGQNSEGREPSSLFGGAVAPSQCGHPYPFFALPVLTSLSSGYGLKNGSMQHSTVTRTPLSGLWTEKLQGIGKPHSEDRKQKTQRNKPNCCI